MTRSANRVVLVVEDDVSMRQAITRLLGAAGLEAAAFASAEDLLAAGVVENGMCLIGDLKLPAMSGLELLDRLRAAGVGQPFILITAHDAPGLEEEASRRGADAYLVKPFRGTALLDLIRQLTAPPRGD